MSHIQITEISNQVVVTDNDAQVISVITAGPAGPPGSQGPAGPQGPAGSGTVNSLADIPDCDINAKVDGSVLYYNSTAAKFKADTDVTITSITDAGNF